MPFRGSSNHTYRLAQQLIRPVVSSWCSKMHSLAETGDVEHNSSLT